jgi:hypothetical protein
LGEYKLPASGSFPAPPEVPSLGPTTGAPLAAALAWSAEISAVEGDRTAELARHASTLGALESRRRAAWAGFFDILGYRLLTENGTPVEISSYVRTGGHVSVVPRDPVPGPSSGKSKGKGKEPAAESEDEDEEEDAESESGTGNGVMDLE